MAPAISLSSITSATKANADYRCRSSSLAASDGLTVLADRGYFSGEEVVACEAAGVRPIVPKPLTSGAKADGRFGKQDFVYQPDTDTYRCPAGEQLIWRFTTDTQPILVQQLRHLRNEGQMHRRARLRHD